MKKDTIHNQAVSIVKSLQQRGYKAYFVGGAVRDILSQIDPKDYDIVTSAKPEEVEKIFPKTLNVGKKFGVIVVIENSKQFEVATFRKDHGYSNHRHPDAVQWSDEKEDALRRDFTINGIFYDPIKEKVIDFVKGQKDLEEKLIAFIGDPTKRIEEDYLRMLRAVRFKNTFGFEYDEKTWQATKDNSSAIACVSAERIRDELNKMFEHPSRGGSLWDLDKAGLVVTIMPELDALHGIDQSWKFHTGGDVFTHTWLAVKALPADISRLVVWGTLLHDIGKPQTKGDVPDKKHGGQRVGFYGHPEVGAKMAEKLLQRLHFSNDDLELVVWLVRHHMMIHEILEMREGRRLRWLRDPRLPLLLELHRADASGKQKTINLNAYNAVKKLMEDELAKPPPPPKLLDGNEIMKEFNLKPGPEIGNLLKIVEDAVWDEKVKTKAEALQLIKGVIKKG